MGELRKRCDELQGEINKMNGEAEQYNKDNETYTKFEKKYNMLITEVRKLQGDLADLNLIADKSRNGTDPQDIDNAYQHLKQVVQPRSPTLESVISFASTCFPLSLRRSLTPLQRSGKIPGPALRRRC
jgi:TolA-binding protein